MKAEVNVFQAQPEKDGTDFDTTISNLCQMVTKKILIEQYVDIAKTGSQQVRCKVATFVGKIECKKYPKAVKNFMTIKQNAGLQALQTTRHQAHHELD